MNWYVVRHPETRGVGVVAESALRIHRAKGWLRVSDAICIDDKYQVVPADYADAPDLDAAPQPAPKTEPTGSKTAAKTSKEN